MFQTDQILDYFGFKHLWNQLKPYLDKYIALVHTTGDETIAGTKTFSSPINGSVSGTAAGLSEVLPIEKGGTGSATQNFVDLITNQSISGAKTFAEGPYGTIDNTESTTIDLEDGCVFLREITANTTIIFTGLPAGKAATFNLILDNGGAFTVTWPATVLWAGGTAPDLSSTGRDVLTFLGLDMGFENPFWIGTLACAGISPGGNA